MKLADGSTITIVMYHYVFDEDDTELNHLKGINTKMFRSQIEFLSKEYQFISILDYLAFILEGKQLPSKSCILSFDDGTADHYNYVYPILKEYGISGFFSVITSAIENRNPLTVHLIHNIIEKFSPQEICSEMNKIISRNTLYSKILSLDYPYSGYPYDTKERAAIKYQLNYCWNPTMTQDIVRQYHKTVFGSLEDFADKFYLKWKDVWEMEEHGMVIGNHSHRHISYSLLNESELKNDIKCSQTIMMDNIQNKKALSLFTYPYGTKDSFNDSTIKCLKEFGYKLAFSCIRGKNELKTDQFRIKRYSTTDFPTKRECFPTI